MSNTTNAFGLLTQAQCDEIRKEFEALVANTLPSNHHFFVAMLPHKDKPTYNDALEFWQKLEEESALKWSGDTPLSTVANVNFGEVVHLDDILCDDTLPV